MKSNAKDMDILQQNEILRLSGLLRVSNTERNAAQMLIMGRDEELRRAKNRIATVEARSAEFESFIIARAQDEWDLWYREQKIKNS